MAVSATYTCAQCGQPISADTPRLHSSEQVAYPDGRTTTRELDFHSYAHLVLWAQAQPEPV